MRKDYPAYFGTYDRFAVRGYVDRFDNLFLIGRNGMHRYNNQDHSMLTAMMAVDNILQDDRQDAICGKSIREQVSRRPALPEELFRPRSRHDPGPIMSLADTIRGAVFILFFSFAVLSRLLQRRCPLRPPSIDFELSVGSTPSTPNPPDQDMLVHAHAAAGIRTFWSDIGLKLVASAGRPEPWSSGCSIWLCRCRQSSPSFSCSVNLASSRFSRFHSRRSAPLDPGLVLHENILMYEIRQLFALLAGTLALIRLFRSGTVYWLVVFFYSQSRASPYCAPLITCSGWRLQVSA